MNADDPRITAFLLGEREIFTPEEIEALEGILAGDPEEKEIRKAVRLLREGFSREEILLREEQERRQETARSRFRLDQGKRLRFGRWIPSLPWRLPGPFPIPALAGLFFCVLVAGLLLGLLGSFPPSLSQRREDPAHTPHVPAAAAETERSPSGSVSSPSRATAAITGPPAPAVRARSGIAAASATSPPQAADSGRGRNRRARQPDEGKVAEAEGFAGATTEGAMTSSMVPFVAGVLGSARALPGHLGAGQAPVPRARPGVLAAGQESDHGEGVNRNAFDAIAENRFLQVYDHPLSTFSADVDTASYSIVRRYLLDRKHWPPKGAVRIEELINYFPYDYPGPKGDEPFSVNVESASCPWAPDHRLVRIGIKARELPRESVPPSNLVFLIDVSGSMAMPNKLPLLRQSLDYLVDQLGEKDRVGIVVYAGAAGCVLLPTGDKEKIRRALGTLEAGGSTNGASGIEMAYDLAERSFLPEGNNRVILATDGDWNVGITSQSELLDLIAKKAKKRIYLTVLGFGMDNLNDSMLVKLADRGNGNYAYIDTLEEARKVFGADLHKTLYTVAEDVKFQVEFNPRKVSAHRLIGYEKRRLAEEEFNDDTKDAGEIGAGHTVTALYEIIPADGKAPSRSEVDPLRYQPNPPEKGGAGGAAVDPAVSNELLTVKIRYKQPGEKKSRRLEFPFTDRGQSWEASSEEFRFAAAVVAFGQMLTKSRWKGRSSWPLVRRLALEGRGKDPYGYRSAFLALVEAASALPADAQEEEEMED
ncbi:conserved protein of unknown function [Methylacidimicrobium sp. AP8]|uniref:vWA domain-containing protein n=1 Tax=Methylacidimicrobium sp. AP8 TaxID=2730359 RepID=UPI0018C139E6|nr:VWA domain-containing protein [Methylacidimicrobium sp. AP8]CAB4243834.1 conserved protein of unknown function [Methylacidimicrobium sp. AP8]